MKLQIWDTASQERFRTIGVGCYYRGARGVITCYDTADMESFDSVKQWLSEIDRYACEDTNRLIVGTKTDLADKRAVDTATALEFAKSVGVPLVECSSKDNVGVDEVFEVITDAILERMISNQGEKH